MVLLCLTPLFTKSASPIEKGLTPKAPIINNAQKPLLVIDLNDKVKPTIDPSISLVLPAQIDLAPGEDTTSPVTCRSCHI